MSNENDQIRVSKTAFQEWLEKLQQESWQLELLISGFALFAIWEARVLVDYVEEYKILQRGGSEVAAPFLSFTSNFLTVAWRIFFFNLLIHVFARSLWIGAIGLRYVSDEINYDSFNYAPIFKKFLYRRVGDFDDYIEKLERFSSVIFAYTFLLLFIFLSLVLFFTEFGIIFTILEDNPAIAGAFVICFLGLGLIAFIDFITMGGIKKIKQKHIAKVYYIFYRIFSFLTLSFLYRPLLYNFWDEKYTRRLFLISIPYILLLALLPRVESEAFPFFPIYHHGHINNKVTEKYAFRSEYYDDEREQVYRQEAGIFHANREIKGVSLPSIEMSGNYGWFFLRIYPDDAIWLEQEKGIIPFKKSGIHLRHLRDLEADSLENVLIEEKHDARAIIISERIKLSRAIESGDIGQVQIGISKNGENFQLDQQYWQSKLDSVEQYWQGKINGYNTGKIQKLRSGILDLATITIDGFDYEDKCDCNFYIHPNIGERGLRCYFPMKNLEEGKHLLHIKRNRFRSLKNDYKDIVDYYIPFYKINKDN